MQIIRKQDVETTIRELSKNGTVEIFDSHEFIDSYRANFEHDYITMLVGNMTPDQPNRAFQQTNSEIGRYLSDYSEELRIVKEENVPSRNDHGKMTCNQKWRILSLFFIVFLSSVFSFSLLAQSEFDMPEYVETKETVSLPDSAYLQNKIRLLTNIRERLDTKKKITNEEEFALYEPIFQKYLKSLSKGNIYEKMAAKGWAKSFAREEIETILRKYLSIEAQAIELQKYKLIKKENTFIPLESAYFTDSIPADVVTVAVPVGQHILDEIITEDRRDYSRSMIYENDNRIFIKGFEWITNTKYGQEYISEQFKQIKYPEVYNVHPDYPDYAVKSYRVRGTDEHTYDFLVYDLNGNLVRLAVVNDALWGEIKAAKDSTYMRDFKANKYGILSGDKTVTLYVEMILDGRYDEMRNGYFGDVAAAAIAESLGLPSNSTEQVIMEKVSDFIKKIDIEKFNVAQSYIKQLEQDHEGEFNYGRLVRIDATSYYMSLVNPQGKKTHLIKVQYKQTGPFEVEKTFSIIE